MFENDRQNLSSRYTRARNVLLVIGAAAGLASMMMHAFAAPVRDGQIIYSINNATPQARAYTAATNAFGAQGATVAGGTPSFTVMRSAPTRNEQIAGYVTTGGRLYILRHNGAAWSNEWNVAVGGDGVNGRRFDIAYESTTGRAMVVYSTNTAGTNELAYRIWNGSTWTAAVNINPARLANVATWVKLLPRAGTNEIALTACDTGSTTTNTADLTTMIWSGTAWGNEPGAAHSTALYNTFGQLVQNDLFDQAWESTTGDLMVVWTQGTPQQYWRAWTRSTATWGTSTSFGTGYSAPLQMSLASDPSSDGVVLIFNRSGSANVYANVWTGAAWSGVSNPAGNGITTANNKKHVTAEWLATGGTSYPVVLWAASTAGRVGYCSATVTGTTVTWNTAATKDFTGTFGNWAWMDSVVDPTSGDTLMLTFSDTNNDLWARRLVLTAGPTLTWTADSSGALSTTLTNNTTQNFCFEYDRLAPTTTIATGTDPANSAICPPGGTPAALDADSFTLETNTLTDSISAVTVSLGTNAWPGVSSVQITNDAGTTTYGSATPAGDSVTVNLTTAIVANTTATQYHVRVVPFAATAIPAPPGATYAVNAYVTGFTSGFAPAGADTAGTTITIDNASPADAAWGTNSAGDNKVSLAWTNPAADFAAVVVLRSTTNPVPDRPAEGVAYTAPATIGTSTIVYSGNLQAFTDSTVTNGTAYYYKIFARDACANYSGGVQTGPLTPSAPIAALTVGAATGVVDSCSQITVTAAFNGDTGTSNSSTTFERATAIGGPFTAVCSGVTGPTPRSCTFPALTANTPYYFRVTFTDPDGVTGQNPQIVGSYTTPVCPAASPTAAGTATAQVSSCNQITVIAPFTGDGNANGSVKVEYNTSNAWPGTVSCAAVSDPSPRQCLVTGLAASTAYYVRVTYSDPDTVTGTNPQVVGPLTTAACGADKVPPMVLFLAPARNAVIGGMDRVKVQVWDAGGLTATNPVQWALDGAALSATGVTQNANYSCGTGCRVYEFDVATSALTNGAHSLTVQATDAAGNVGRQSVAIVVNTSGTTAKGGGTLLRRTYGSQLCIDCHALATHSSQMTSSKYGNWSIDCLTCHTPHDTQNIELVRRQIRTPNSGVNTIDFRLTDVAGGGEPQYSHLGDASGTNYTDGICETCHTKTNHYRNDLSGGDHTHNSTTRCIGCHQHQKGFAASESVGGYSCSSCHPAIWNGMTGGVAKATKHALGAVLGTNDAFTDTSLSWGNPLNANAAAARSCVNMCHQDHVHNNPGGATHDYNVHQDAATQAARAVTRDAAGNITAGTPNRTDFDDAAASGGLCLSCHKNPVDAARPALAQSSFNTSAHNYTTFSTYGPWVYTLHDGSAFDRNCTKCHADPGDSRPADANTPFGAVHFSDNPSLLAGSVNPNGAPASLICYVCHGGGTTGADYSSKPVYQDAVKAYAHPMNADTVHNSTTEFTNATWGNTLGVTGRHANCQDCHAPHVAQKTIKRGTATAATTTTLTDSSMNGRWTASQWVGSILYVPSLAAGQNTRNITASTAAGVLTVAAWTTAPAAGAAYYILDNKADGALAGAWGAQLSTNPALWTAPAAGNFTKQTLGAGSGLQATLCFKCHSSYYWGTGTPPNGLSPNGTVSTPVETDVAMEFNPANRSGHPVLASLNNYTGNVTPKALTAAQLSAPWNVNVGTQTMSCSDCHNTDAASPAAQGPHGSAMKFMLAGTNKYWPENASGTAYTLGNNPTNNTFLAGLFCLNCHPMFTGGTNSTTNWAGNNVHWEHSGPQLGNVNCYRCHIIIPHGGKVSRLIATNTTGLPARYAYSNTQSNVYVTQFKKAAGPGSYDTPNCNTSCNGHGPITSPETW